MSPRTSEQIREIREERQAVILQAALKCFAEYGFNGASISQIAREAGISKGLIYNYFDSKDALLHAIIYDIFEEIMEKFDFPANGEMTKADFCRFIEISLDLVAEDPDRYKLYFGLLTQPAVAEMFMQDMLEKMQPMIVMWVDYYRRQGLEDPVTMMRFVSAAIDGVQMHIMLDPDNFPKEKVKELIIKMFG